jgi:hypothetical protein
LEKRAAIMLIQKIYRVWHPVCMWRVWRSVAITPKILVYTFPNIKIFQVLPKNWNPLKSQIPMQNFFICIKSLKIWQNA